MQTMTMIDALGVIVTFGAALLVVWVLLSPFFIPEREEKNSDDREAELLLQKEEVLSALEELEEDLIAKRIDTVSYEAAKKELLQRAASCSKQLAVNGE